MASQKEENTEEVKHPEAEIVETSVPEEDSAEGTPQETETKVPEAFGRAGKSRAPRGAESAAADTSAWVPKTVIGKKVKAGEITDVDTILESGNKIMEPEIIDTLMPDMQSDLLLIGQSKGKYVGGARRVFRQTQKKTKEGNKPSFATYAVIGDNNGHVGLGYGKSKETVPAREKAIRNAKLSIIKIRRGSGSWESNVPEPHSIPFAVEGKCSSVIVKLMPAPKGTGLVCQSEIQKILKLAGIQDVWSKTSGKTTSRINLIKATFEALRQLKKTKIQPRHVEEVKIFE